MVVESVMYTIWSATYITCRSGLVVEARDGIWRLAAATPDSRAFLVGSGLHDLQCKSRNEALKVLCAHEPPVPDDASLDRLIWKPRPRGKGFVAANLLVKPTGERWELRSTHFDPLGFRLTADSDLNEVFRRARLWHHVMIRFAEPYN